MKKIAIIGHGYVGEAMDRFFRDHYSMVIYDPFKTFSAEDFQRESSTYKIAISPKEVNECDLAVVCVPTPMSDTGDADLTQIQAVIDMLETPLILIKSTVPPGTTARIAGTKKVAFSPEYIGEGKYVTPWWKDKGYPHPTDMKFHDFIIVGGHPDTTGPILEFFKKVLGPDAKYMETNSTTAELVKYMENSWGATKVTFANEFANIAKAFGVSYNQLRELFLLDGRTERMHTLVFEESPGFGGKCFPKDVNAIAEASTKAGYDPKLLRQVLASNKEFRHE